MSRPDASQSVLNFLTLFISIVLKFVRKEEKP